MKKRIFSLVLALSCMAVLSACGEEETAETEESSTAVEIATVERGSISSESNVSGQVVSDGQESVSVALSVRCSLCGGRRYGVGWAGNLQAGYLRHHGQL